MCAVQLILVISVPSDCITPHHATICSKPADATTQPAAHRGRTPQSHTACPPPTAPHPATHLLNQLPERLGRLLVVLLQHEDGLHVPA